MKPRTRATGAATLHVTARGLTLPPLTTPVGAAPPTLADLEREATAYASSTACAPADYPAVAHEAFRTLVRHHERRWGRFSRRFASWCIGDRPIYPRYDTFIIGERLNPRMTRVPAPASPDPLPAPF